MSEEVKNETVEEEVSAKEPTTEESTNDEEQPGDDVILDQMNKLITENTVAIINSPEVQGVLKEIKHIDEDDLKSIVKVLAMTVNMSCVTTTVFYDHILGEEIKKKFQNMVDHINSMKADIIGVKEAIRVHNNKISDLEKNAIVSDIKKQ